MAGATPNRDRIAVASKTYRKAVNKTAQALHIPPIHTRRPSDDFDNMLEARDAKSRKRALEWYRRGIRLGYDKGTTAVVDGKLGFDKAGNLLCPRKVTVTKNIKFSGTKRKSVKFTFTASELGFK